VQYIFSISNTKRKDKISSICFVRVFDYVIYTRPVQNFARELNVSIVSLRVKKKNKKV